MLQISIVQRKGQLYFNANLLAAFRGLSRMPITFRLYRSAYANGTGTKNVSVVYDFDHKSSGSFTRLLHNVLQVVPVIYSKSKYVTQAKSKIMI
jgi:hypothetical protein